MVRKLATFSFMGSSLFLMRPTQCCIFGSSLMFVSFCCDFCTFSFLFCGFCRSGVVGWPFSKVFMNLLM